MKPELQEMTFKQLIDEATWAVVQQVINGTVRDGVVDAINLYGAWRELQSVELQAVPQALLDELQLLEYYVDNPSAWDSYSKNVNIAIRHCVSTVQVGLAALPRIEAVGDDMAKLREEAAMYRFWRDMACSNPIIVAKALAPCLTPESIDAALRDLMALKQGDEE